MKFKLGRRAGGAQNAASFSTLLRKRKENKGQEGKVLGVNDPMYLCHCVFTDHISNYQLVDKSIDRPKNSIIICCVCSVSLYWV